MAKEVNLLPHRNNIIYIEDKYYLDVYAIVLDGDDYQEVSDRRLLSNNASETYQSLLDLSDASMIAYEAELLE